MQFISLGTILRSQSPPANQALTNLTSPTPIMYIGVDGQSYLGYWNGNHEVFFNIVAPDTRWTVDVAGIGEFGVAGDGTVGHGSIPRLFGIGTQGTGIAGIYQKASNKNLSAASTNFINYTTVSSPAGDNSSTYRLTGVINMTSWTTPASFNVQVVYTDDSGGARTDILGLVRGSTGATATAVTAVDRWFFYWFGRCASATAITVSTVGTFTGSPSYNQSAILEVVGY